MKDRSIQNINTAAKSYLCGGNHHNLLKIIECHFVTRLGPMMSRLKGKFLFPVKPETVDTRVIRGAAPLADTGRQNHKKTISEVFSFYSTIKTEIFGFIQCRLMH